MDEIIVVGTADYRPLKKNIFIPDRQQNSDIFFFLILLEIVSTVHISESQQSYKRKKL